MPRALLCKRILYDGPGCDDAGSMSELAAHYVYYEYVAMSDRCSSLTSAAMCDMASRMLLWLCVM